MQREAKFKKRKKKCFQKEKGLGFKIPKELL